MGGLGPTWPCPPISSYDGVLHVAAEAPHGRPRVVFSLLVAVIVYVPESSSVHVITIIIIILCTLFFLPQMMANIMLKRAGRAPTGWTGRLLWKP